MADERELRVERRDVHTAESGKTVPVVWLECAEGRAGPLEDWMQSWCHYSISIYSLPEWVQEIARQEEDAEAAVSCIVGDAIASILKEAQNAD